MKLEYYAVFAHSGDWKKNKTKIVTSVTVIKSLEINICQPGSRDLLNAKDSPYVIVLLYVWDVEYILSFEVMYFVEIK